MFILLVDDEPMVCKALSDFVREQLGHTVLTSRNGDEALKMLEHEPIDMVLTDIRMPGINGLQLLEQIRKGNGPQPDVVLITAHGDLDSAIQALRAGASDFIRKPVNIEELAEIIERIETRRKQAEDRSRVPVETRYETTPESDKRYQEFRASYVDLVNIGRIGLFSETIRNIVRLAKQFHEDRSVPVLIEGETGTGKEIVARLIHYGNSGNPQPFLPVNCSAISSTLFESELFGYEGGAFTGAKKEGMKGKLELANGGTIFFDELGDLPLEMQPKILRTLQELEFFRVGGVKKITIDVRVLCATNQDINKMIEEGKFRKDLFYRLNVGRIVIPPLRERKNEIAPLAQMFLERYAEDKKRRFKVLTGEAIEMLKEHSWPGNVRELQNAIERVVLLYDDIELRPEYIHFLGNAKPSGDQAGGTVFVPDNIVLPDSGLELDQVEHMIIKKALKKFDGNKTRAAKYLGLTRSTLRSRLRKIT